MDVEEAYGVLVAVKASTITALEGVKFDAENSGTRLSRSDDMKADGARRME